MLKSSFTKDLIEAGVDEVGRGCLAGPVVAAAVILPKRCEIPILNDSKQVTKKDRDILEKEIKNIALEFAIAEVWNEKIDKINILNASFLAMHEALRQLKTCPQLLLVDGNRFKPYQDVKFECIIKGDGIYASIAAASILAKTHRDRLMENLAKEHPEYDWHTNVGYPTIAHRSAIKKYGITTYHRKSFRLLPDQLELFAEDNEPEVD